MIDKAAACCMYGVFDLWSERRPFVLPMEPPVQMKLKFLVSFGLWLYCIKSKLLFFLFSRRTIINAKLCCLIRSVDFIVLIFSFILDKWETRGGCIMYKSRRTKKILHLFYRKIPAMPYIFLSTRKCFVFLEVKISPCEDCLLIFSFWF